MPNLLDQNGLQVATQTEQVTFLTGWYESIYGQGIDLSSSSQDGQMLRIYVQVVMDIADVIQGVYNSRDINQAVGTQLDTLVYWIQRQGGTYTIQNLLVTVPGAMTLYGLDQTALPVFSFQDPQGNVYQLQTTQNPAGAGSYSYSFQAQNPGAVSSALNTINIPVTVVPNVAGNNPTTYTTLGQDEETDFYFRLRALASVAIPSQGFFGGLYATLGNVPQAAKVQVYENPEDTVSPNQYCSVAGVPGHGIWCVVQGSAAPADVAQAIYSQRSLGCNMRGAQVYNVTQDDGSLFPIFWDFVSNGRLYIQMTVQSINGTTPPNIAAILAQLPGLLLPTSGTEVNINEVATLVQEIDPNTLVTSCGLSLSSTGPFTALVNPSSAAEQLRVASADIYILPMALLPQTSAVAAGGPVQFYAYGGIQTGYVYSISTNNSGGTINASTGAYVAGSTPGVDTITVTDSNSNTATASVVVS